METQTITPEAPVHVDTLINVTEAAAGKIRELLSEEGKAESGLRVLAGMPTGSPVSRPKACMRSLRAQSVLLTSSNRSCPPR